MRVTVVRPAELGPSEATLWANFQQKSTITVNPFLSLTFAQAAGRARSNARVAIIENGGKIAAFLPFERHALAMGVPIGYPMNDLHGFIGSDALFDARTVVRKAGLRGWRFDHAPAEQQALAPFHYKRATVQAPVMDLRRGYDFYLGSRSKNFRQTAGRKRRNLEREIGPLSIRWDSPDPKAELKQLINQKSGKYHGTRLLFSDPTALRIVEELATVDNPDCRGFLIVVHAGERPIARLMGTYAHGILNPWFASYDPDLSRFSPGITMYLALAAEGTSRGFDVIDLCSGQDLYKFHLANDSYPVATGAVWVSRAESLTRKMYRRFMRDKPAHERLPGWVRSRTGIHKAPDDSRQGRGPVPASLALIRYPNPGHWARCSGASR
jgi:CelD/BcsL family acetyltransferase involved in cellulose biosynthesis